MSTALTIHLPSPPIERDWSCRIEPWLQRPIHMPIPEPPIGIRHAVELNAAVVQSGLHWMIRHTWTSKYRHPTVFNRSIIQGTKSLGLWLKAIRNLCIQSHMLTDEMQIQPIYTTPAEWFHEIIRHVMYEGLDIAIFNLYQESPKETAREQIRVMSAICSKIKSFEPIQARSPLADLLNFAMILAQRYDIFQKEHFKPLIEAWRAMIQEKDRLHKIHLISAEKFHFQAGRGRGTINLISPSKNRSPKRTDTDAFKT